MNSIGYARVIEIEPSWKSVGYFADLISHPPEGYKFIYPRTNAPIDELFGLLSRTNFAYDIQRSINRIVPLQLMMSHLRGMRRTQNLVFSETHLHMNGPYVLNMGNELPDILAMSSMHLARFKGYIKNQLLSDNCKHVICWVNAGREAFVQALGDDVADKVSTVYWGKPPRRFTRSDHDKSVKLLFVNSANMNAPFHFYNKGGRLVVEAFLKLRRKHRNLELTIRSSLPNTLKELYSQVPGIKVISEPVPWGEMLKEWTSADVFVLPNHINTPANVFLDAMSFGLPIVTTNIWANPEIVYGGETGFLVEHPDSHVLLNGYLFVDSPHYRRIISGSNPLLVDRLASALEILIEDEDLRKDMGKRAQALIENGKFSIEQRNSRLKSVLDMAYNQ